MVRSRCKEMIAMARPTLREELLIHQMLSAIQDGVMFGGHQIIPFAKQSHQPDVQNGCNCVREAEQYGEQMCSDRWSECRTLDTLIILHT